MGWGLGVGFRGLGVGFGVEVEVEVSLVDGVTKRRFGTGEAPAFAFMVGFQPHGGSNQEIQP
ncbi:hypothetical protein PWYN_25275 [Paenibacillus wynnii]|uniref:Uncharacterized protein n=1 Tax=Paenibacillus wynnii TaxID=268407 RepID=A0A098M744_9BACL|nr:hypothetical protein PWYN_25275 [Paenibacillus wynnii]